jgi:outer membrane beta-barrel protein
MEGTPMLLTRMRAPALALALTLAATMTRAAEPAPADPWAAPPVAVADSASVPAADPFAPAPGRDSLTAPAASAAALANPRLTGVRMVRLVRGRQIVSRSGPGDDFSIVGVHPKGARFPVLSRTGDWYDVKLSESESGWIHASLCQEYDDLSDLEYRPNPKVYVRTGTYVLTAYSGGYAFDRKSNSLVAGGNLGYYLFDRVQVEGGAAWTHVRRPAEIVESLFDLSLEAEDFHMLFYHLAVTYEVLPGRQMVPYLSAGVGSTILRGESDASVDFGAGTALFLSRRTAMRWEVRNHRFASGPDASRRTNNNIVFTLGTSYLF